MPKLNRPKNAPGQGRPCKPRASLPKREPLAKKHPKPNNKLLDVHADPGTDTGLRACIERLHLAEIAAAADFEAARTTGDPALVARKKKDWLDLCESLRKIEVSTPGVLSENRATMPVEDAAAEFAKVATQFRIGLEALPRSLPPRLVGLDEAGIQEVLRASTIEVLEQLATEKW